MTTDNVAYESEPVETTSADAPEVETSSVDTPVQPEVSESSEAEKLVPQETVNNLVAAKKKEAYEKGMREALEKFGNNQAEANDEVVTPTNEVAPSQDEDKLAKLVNERFEQEVARQQETLAKQQHEQKTAEVTTQLKSKFDAASNKYDDFAQKMQEAEATHLPDAFFAALNVVDNSGDVMYELANSPAKRAELLSQIDIASNPNVSQATRNAAIAAVGSHMDRLSQSIKTNEQGRVQPAANAPLSTVKPSNVGTNDGPMSVADYRNKFRGKL